MKKIILLCALLPIVLSAMKNNKHAKKEYFIGALVTLDDVSRLQPLEQKPEPGSIVAIDHGDCFRWALVRGIKGKDFCVLHEQEHGASLGILLPLEDLYMLKK